MKRLNSAGSHIVAIAVGILVIGVAAFGAYAVQHQNSSTDTTTASTSSSSGDINNTADLTKAATELDSSSTQVDSSLNDASLDSDLNDLL
jgi:hypothetical protein